jgi:transposase
VLREIGTTRRGLGDEFYRLVAQSYRAFAAEAEPYPVKALAEMHHVVISTASRWINEAKRRGYIDDGKEQS